MNEDLISKYNVPTPRYTSYPPANYFHDKFTNEDYEKAVISSNETTPQNISFYIHIPFAVIFVITADATLIPWQNPKSLKRT